MGAWRIGRQAGNFCELLYRDVEGGPWETVGTIRASLADAVGDALNAQTSQRRPATELSSGQVQRIMENALRTPLGARYAPQFADERVGRGDRSVMGSVVDADQLRVSWTQIPNVMPLRARERLRGPVAVGHTVVRDVRTGRFEVTIDPSSGVAGELTVTERANIELAASEYLREHGDTGGLPQFLAARVERVLRSRVEGFGVRESLVVGHGSGGIAALESCPPRSPDDMPF